MTDNQRKFADEYLIDCNARRAYSVAYPSVKKQNVIDAAASRLLSNVKVKTYIDEQLEKISSKKIASASEVMEYLTSVLRGTSESEEIVVEGCGDGISVARTMTKQPSEKDKLKAAELLGKRYGLYTDKIAAEIVQPVFGGEEDLED